MVNDAEKYMEQHKGEWFTRAQVTGMVEQHAKDWKQACTMYANAWTRELRQGEVMTSGWGKHHQIDALVVVTRDVIAELKRLREENRILKVKVNMEYRASIGEVHHWTGDGTDDLDSLICPVLISPDDLQQLLIKEFVKSERFPGDAVI